MKRIQILTVVLFAMVAIKAQSPADELFDKYAGKEGFTTVYISKYMFDLFNSIESSDPEAKEMTEVISKLTGIKILASEKPDESVNFLKEMKKYSGTVRYVRITAQSTTGRAQIGIVQTRKETHNDKELPSTHR